MIKATNKLLKPRSGAKIRASTGQSKHWSFCEFASQIITQKTHHFACRLAKR
jgi:hypothetical protein